MKELKRRMERFSFYDHTGIERHLERMASEGWMLEKIGFLWRYKRCEPRKFKFSVTFYPRASVFDPEPTAGELDFQAFCERTGWKLAASNAQLQVFYNENPDPVPIDTDPMTEVETLHNSAKRAYLPSYFLLLLVSALQLAMFFSDLVSRPFFLLSSGLKLFSGPVFLLLAVLLTAELAGYYAWRQRACKAALRGEFLRTKSHTQLQTVFLLAACVFMLAWIVSIVLEGDLAFRLLFLATLGISALIVVLTRGTMAALKRLKAPRGLNRVLTIALPTVIGTALMVGLTFMVISSARDGGLTVAKNDLPLMVEDLVDVDAGEYIRERTGEETVFLSRFECRQHPGFDSAGYGELPELSYEIVSVKMPFLYDLALNGKLKEYSGRKYYQWVPTDPEPWGAAEAWALMDRETGELQNRFLLCSENRIVDITFTWLSDASQMMTVGEKLL